MSQYEIQHGGTIQLPQHDTLEEAVLAAIRVKCAKPVQVFKRTGPNEWATELVIMRGKLVPLALMADELAVALTLLANATRIDGWERDNALRLLKILNGGGA